MVGCRILNLLNDKFLLALAPPSWEIANHFFALAHLPVSLSPYFPVFSLERSLDQVSDEPLVRDPSNFEGSGHPGLRRDIRVGIDFQHIDFPIPVDAEIHSGIIPASE